MIRTIFTADQILSKTIIMFIIGWKMKVTYEDLDT